MNEQASSRRHPLQAFHSLADSLAQARRSGHHTLAASHNRASPPAERPRPAAALVDRRRRYGAFLGLRAGEIATTGLLTNIEACQWGDRVTADIAALGGVSARF